MPSLPISVGRRGGLVNNSRRDEPGASPSVTLHKARRYHSTATTLRRYVDCLSISQIKEYQTRASSLYSLASATTDPSRILDTYSLVSLTGKTNHVTYLHHITWRRLMV